jgi:hypothetical protein
MYTNIHIDFRKKCVIFTAEWRAFHVCSRNWGLGETYAVLRNTHNSQGPEGTDPFSNPINEPRDSTMDINVINVTY